MGFRTKNGKFLIKNGKFAAGVDGSACGCCGGNCGYSCLPTPGAAVLGAGSVHEGFATFPATTGWLDITDQITGGQYVEQRDYGATHIDYGPQKLEIQLSRASETSAATTAIMRVAYLTKSDGTVIVSPANLTVSIGAFASTKYNMRIGTNAWPATGIACGTGLKTRNFINSYLTNPAAGTELYKIRVADVDMHRFTTLSTIPALSQPVKRPDQWTGSITATVEINYPNGEDQLVTTIPAYTLTITPAMNSALTEDAVFTFTLATLAKPVAAPWRDEPLAYTESRGLVTQSLTVTPVAFKTGPGDILCDYEFETSGVVTTGQLTILAASLKAYKFVTMPFARKTAPYRLFPDPVPAIGFSLPTFVVSSYAADPAFVPGSGVSSTVTTTFQVYDSVVDGAPAGVVIASLEIVDLFINVGAEDAGLIRLPGTQIVPNESTFCGKRSSRFVLAYGMATGSPISEHSYSGVASGAGWQASWFICGNITERIVNGAPWTGGIMGGIAITGTPTLSFTSPAEWHLYIPKIGPWGSTNEERVSTTLTGTLDNVSTQTFTSPVYVEPWGTTLQFTIELYVFVSVAVRGEVLQIPDKKLTRPSPDIRVQTLAEVMAFSMVQGHYTNSSELRVPTGAELKFSFYGVKADRTQSPPVMSYSNTINFYSWTQIFTTNGGFEPLIWDNGVFLLPTPTPTSQYNGAVEKVRCEGDQVVVESTLKSISNPAHLNPQPDPITQDMYYARNAIGGYHPETSIMGVTVAQFWEGGVPGGPIGTADQSTLTYDLP